VVYLAPELRSEELRAIEAIEELQRELRWRVAEPKRWYGNLRRRIFARAVQGSNSIEGYNASLEDVMAAVDNQAPIDADLDTYLALEGYRDAMTYVLQLAEDRAGMEVDETLIKALHFMMLKHELNKCPGRYRPGVIYVRREPSGEVVYEGPDADTLPSLMAELVDSLASHDLPALVAAAMAHLNLVMIHPFKDGNGRMARCLQTFVLARENIVAPVFSSIEEYLGRNTEAYYSVLAEVGRGGWHPSNEARLWVRFCLNAHYQQTRTQLWRIQEAEALWDRCEHLAREHRLPERVVGPLCDSARGLTLRNPSYRTTVLESTGDGIDVQTASRDLRALVEVGLLESRGETRGRLYVGTLVLRQVHTEVRAMKPRRETVDLFPPESQLNLLTEDSPNEPR
jgi:Fic family protein